VVIPHSELHVNGGRISTVVDLHEVVHRVVLDRPAPSHDEAQKAVRGRAFSQRETVSGFTPIRDAKST